MTIRISTPVALIVALVSGPVLAAQKIPLSAAMAQCDKQKASYSETLGDGGADTPTEYKLDTRYRSCVFAKSGSYPPKKKARSGVRISGSATIGIVVD